MGKQNLFNTKILDASSMAANVTSAWVDLSRVDVYSLTAKWTGSPVGTFKLQFSLDESDPRDIPETIISVNGADVASFTEANAAYDKVRAVYTRTSGSGNLTVQINGKGSES